MFDFIGFKAGAAAFLLAFVVAGLFTIAFKYVYQWVTPYNEKALIRQGNLAAAIALAGALIGYVLPLASALSHTVSLPEFAAWATLAGVIQIAAFTGVGAPSTWVLSNHDVVRHASRYGLPEHTAGPNAGIGPNSPDKPDTTIGLRRARAAARPARPSAVRRISTCRPSSRLSMVTSEMSPRPRSARTG